ncbi:hypothetical protein [Undibacterium sp. RuRC25W]|uniref:hypothetical protein n=1 Tax=Undibacterium sp. RuRC25W TaxID=3413047 RepID=UPI003BF04D66
MSRLMLVFFCVLSFTCVCYCVPAGIADLVTLDQRYVFNQSQPVNGSLEMEGRFLKHLFWATELAPESPDYYERIAYMFAIQGAGLLNNQKVSEQKFILAEKNYRHALMLRPMSSILFANLALLKFYRKAPKAEINQLTITANLYGRNDPQKEKTLLYLNKLNDGRH